MMDWKTFEGLVSRKPCGRWLIIIHMGPWSLILLANTWKPKFYIY